MNSTGEPALLPAATVLRDVVMNAQPHALTRPGRLNAVHAHGVFPDSPQGSQAHQGTCPAGTYDEGLEEGLAEGLRQGRAQALAEAGSAQEDATRDLVEAARRAAQEQGLQEGMQEGLKRSAQLAQEQARDVREAADAALEEAMREIDERCARLDRLLATCLTERARLLANCEDEIVLIVHEAICKVLGSEAVKPQVILAMVKQLIAQHGLREALFVHLHPDDAQAMRIAHGSSSLDDWQYVPDASVGLGGVILRSANGSVDARLETQIQSLGDALVAVRRERQLQSAKSTRDGS
ncbi:FliH/SctL family protein [Caenimonas sp. SL110]|uniref:FliH/SctL family protein n=1 Tax=Caenimonas sp. SL110 TaxID=1450524 RepID=UPI00137928C6|nr:FliH/SctL family protein [Caenimonas sp. SL110]